MTTSARTDDIAPAPSDAAAATTLHGITVPDPYRPLEDLDAPATVAWWKAQNERTEELLAATGDLRATVTAWHESIRDYTRESIPARFGGNEFLTRQEGLDSQPTYYVRAIGDDADARVLVDPKLLSDDGTIAIGGLDASPDGTLVAYTISEAGSDLQSMRFRDVATGEDVHEELTELRFTSATWDPDGVGVSYTRPLTEEESGGGKHLAAFRHAFGTPQSSDEQIFARTDIPNSFVGSFRLTEEDETLFHIAFSGTDPKNGLYVRRPGADDAIEIQPVGVASLIPFHRDGDTLFAVTDLDAPRGRIVTIDMTSPAPDSWVTLVAESDDAGSKLRSAFVADDHIIVMWTRGGADALELRTRSGERIDDVPLPTGSTVALGHVRPADTSFEVSVGGYLSPGTRYRYTVATNELAFLKKSDIPRDLVDIAIVERLYATSADGTAVPMWVIRRKDTPLDGSAATVLYGYGGFNVPLLPWFSFDIAHWVDRGGIYAVANLRGGGEFGSEWYDAGRLANKQNVFDDFAACARHLVAEGYTSASRLAISGGSNGGLLTAATSQQHPELFGAVISQVPVTDLVRFPTDNFGAAWISDYGDPQVEADLRTALAYSPLHNVVASDEVSYPPTLVLTGDHDDRVAPWHAMKWAATRQAAGHTNTWLRVDERAGHGAGKPTAKQIAESADVYAFLMQALTPV